MFLALASYPRIAGGITPAEIAQRPGEPDQAAIGKAFYLSFVGQRADQDRLSLIFLTMSFQDA